MTSIEDIRRWVREVQLERALGMSIDEDLLSQLRLPPDATESAAPLDHLRRATGRRAVDLADYRPGPKFLLSLPQRTHAGAIKLSPALDLGALDLPGGVQCEYLSEGRTCKQLVLWWCPAPDLPARLATVLGGDLSDPQATTLPAEVAPPAPLRDPDAPGEYLIEPDPAVIAAGAVDDLAARFGLCRIAPRLDWCVADSPVHTPLARNYRILRVEPGRPRNVARAVRELEGGIVEIKPRGLKLDTDTLQRRLRGRGDRTLTLCWADLHPRQIVFLCERI